MAIRKLIESLNHLVIDDISRTQDALITHPTTAHLSFLLKDVSSYDANDEVKEELKQVLDYHSQEWLGKEREKTIENGNSHVSILPTRGCIVTDLTLNSTPIFYHDENIAKNMQKSLRSTYWMVPYAGPAPQHNSGSVYNLQHGYGREIERQANEKTGFDINVGDIDVQETIPNSFVHDLHAHQDALLEKNKAYFILTMENRGTTLMPCAPGNHTYYNVSADKKDLVTIEGSGLSPATLAYYLKNGIGPNGEKTLKFQNPGKPLKVFLPGVGTILIRLGSSFTNVRVWTEPGKPFVCIEPVARGDSKDPIPTIEPGKTKEYWFSVELVEKDTGNI